MKKNILNFALIMCMSLLMVTIFTGCSSDNDEEVSIPTDYTITMESNYPDLPEQTIQHRITIINDSDYGTIYPKLDNGTSSVLVDEGDSYTVTIKVNDGYELDYLLIDGKSVEAVDVYTFTNVDKDHNISAVYSEIIDMRHFIKEIAMVGMIFDLSPATATQEVESVQYSLKVSKYSISGSSSSVHAGGYVYSGESAQSKFTNSLNFGSQIDISFNDSASYGITLSIDNHTIIAETFIPNKLELEHISDNMYMLKLNNQSNNYYALENIVLYFTATFE